MSNCFINLFTTYTTTRIVRIQSKFLGVTYLILVILVWGAFLASYELDFRYVYQKTCAVYGTTSTKMKGIVSTEHIPNSLLLSTFNGTEYLYKRVWDVSDVVYPPDGSKEFFVLTNLVITPNQTRGVCPESYKIKNSRCTKNSDCENGTLSVNGVRTGICSTHTNTCEISAWCPTEHEDSPKSMPLYGVKALLEDTKLMTLMIKNSIKFPECGKNYQRRNIIENATSAYLSVCRYDPISHPYCPIFELGKIVEWSGENYTQVAVTGGVFTVHIVWECQFDWGETIQDCFPTYSFSRTDEAHPKISPGWNFRSAIYHEAHRRTLMKQYGLKFIIDVDGEGKKFDFLRAVVNVGASLGLFALAPLFCDFLLDLICYFRNCFPFKFWFSNFNENMRCYEMEDSDHLRNDKIVPTRYDEYKI